MPGASSGSATCSFLASRKWRSFSGGERVARNFRIVEYEFPEGSCAAYYPETNALIPLGSHDPLSHTPGIPVRITRSSVA